MAGALVTALLHGDSSVPTGGFAFSWGLEALYREELISERDPWSDVLNWYLTCRWAGFDRYFLCESREADLGGRTLLDATIDAASFSEAGRRASRRAGMVFLSTWARAGSAAAQEYRERVDDGECCGHLPIVQGLVYAEDGLDAAEASAVSAWTLVSGLTSAAVRLGTVGALTAQRTLREIVPVISELVQRAAPAEPETWGMLQDIAMDRHSHQELRLFAS